MLRHPTLAVDAESGDGIAGRIVDALHRFADDREAGDAVSPPFTIVPGGSSSPCILHVPHASEVIPDDVRKDMLLDDCALELELRAMTDAHTDLIAAGVADLVDGPRPWMFVNCLSRLVVDPERFPDEREVMNAVGMGAVYTRTSTGEALRDDNPKERAEMISSWFDPYAAALAGLVDARIEAAGFALIGTFTPTRAIRCPTSSSPTRHARKYASAATRTTRHRGYARSRMTPSRLIGVSG